MKLFRAFLTLAALFLAAPVVQAELLFTFDNDTQGVTGGVWNAGYQALQQQTGGGGWTAGNGGPWFNFGAMGYDDEIRDMLATGNGRVELDIWVDPASFSPDADAWYQYYVVGNSAAPNEWTQTLVRDGWHPAGDQSVVSDHVDLSFAELGWEAGDTWFQLWFGSNSDANQSIDFYVDNVKLSAVPEPGTLSLAGIGLFGLLVLALRRRCSIVGGSC